MPVSRILSSVHDNAVAGVGKIFKDASIIGAVPVLRRLVTAAPPCLPHARSSFGGGTGTGVGNVASRPHHVQDGVSLLYVHSGIYRHFFPDLGSPRIDQVSELSDRHAAGVSRFGQCMPGYTWLLTSSPIEPSIVDE